MKQLIRTIIAGLFVLLFLQACKNTHIDNYTKHNTIIIQDAVKKPTMDFGPGRYVCYTARDIKIDGILSEPSWQLAEWTDDFRDIEGDIKPEPLQKTRVKMLWDKEYLYIAAEITEQHIWAKLQQRDTVIFYDNDFEVFIDPDGDTHGYYEFEINAFNTIWDLLLTKPYRDKGSAIDAWDIAGIKTAVKIHGTINNPSDTDDKWIVELAFPFSVLEEWGSLPSEGSQWRINFSRVNWRTVIENNNYTKEINPETGKGYPEYNWVWSPQGVINMHYPEMWGFLQFTETIAGEDTVGFIDNPDEMIKWNLRTLYYAQRQFAEKNARYSDKVRELIEFDYEEFRINPDILVKPYGYEAYILSDNTGLLWIINDEGRIHSNKVTD